ncbi:MAG: ACP S-malonyltransferase [Planctomycetia bacterium]|nr:ACP S-malonyltransferase [Planctomycetia bacterium]
MGKGAVLFPGQGAQSVGMGKMDYDLYPSVRKLYARANEIVGYDLAQLIFSGPEDRLNTTEQSQPAIFLTSMGAILATRENNPDLEKSFEYTAGLSLGEYSALVYAGAISFEDGLRLVSLRGKAMQQASEQSNGGMVSIIGLPEEKVLEIADAAGSGDLLTVANFLCPKNYVVSGTKTACEKAILLAREAGAIKTIPLTVAGAFHTDLMRPAMEQMKEVLQNIPFNAPRIPVISNVDAKPHSDPDDIRTTLLAQICSSVRWESCIRAMIADGVDYYHEVEPGRVLRGLMKRIDRSMKTNKE